VSFSIAQSAQAVNNHTPVVVVDGSGKAADIISYAWRYLHANEYGFSSFVLLS
jgi:hypothetical protein